MKVKKYRNSPKQAALKQGANLMLRIEKKGMPFDHDFCYSFPLFSSLLKKEGREKENEIVKIVIKSHTFLLDQF